MKLLEHWHILAANGLWLVLALLIRRWDRGILLGQFGLALIILPVAFGYLGGRMELEMFLGILSGVIILAADLTRKLPRRDRNKSRLSR